MPKEILLREYQHRAVEAVRNEILKGNRRIVLVMPTGAGKSYTFADIINRAVTKSNKVLWLVHRRNLVTQMQQTLWDYGVNCGQIMSGIESNVYEPVQIGTVQTYNRRLQLEDLEVNKFFINANVLMIDEGHRAMSRTYQQIMELYPEAVIIACTATPERADGRGLGEAFDSLVDVVSTQELTDLGYLTPVRYFVPETVDTEGIRVVRGDFDNKQLAERCDKSKIVGGVVENWLRIAEGRKTLVYAVNVRHSLHLRDAFLRAGITAEHLDARSTDEERDAVFNRMERGQTTVITNVALYQEGLDVPGISCVQMARPTKSFGLYRQCGGRGLRPLEGKDDCMFIDHGGNVERLGFLTDEIAWTLDGTKKAGKRKERKVKGKRVVQCRACDLVFEGTSECPDCGTQVKAFGKDVKTAEGELKELNPKKNNREYTWADKRMLMAALNWHAQQKGYKNGWASHSYRDFFGVWPQDSRVKDVPPTKPEGKVALLLKHILIKKAKQYKKIKGAA